MQRIKKILQFLLLFSLLFYILRMASPYIVYLFFPAYIIYILILSIFVYKERKYKDLIKTLKEFKIIVFLGVLILTGIAITGFNGFRGILGIVNFLILYSYVFGFILLNPNKESFLLSIREFEKYFVYAGVTLSVLGLIKLFFVLKGLPYPDSFSTAVNSSLDKDYNFFALTGILSFLLVAIRKENAELRYSKVLLQALMYILFLSVIFTGSRRGFLAITIITVFIFSFSLFGQYFRLNEYKIFCVLKGRLYMVLVLCSIAISLFFQYYLPGASRNKLVLESGLNTYKTRFFLASTIHSFYTIFNSHSDYSIIYNQLWDSGHDPKSPFSGWGKGSFIPVYDIEGENSEIVPQGSIGYLIDKNSNWTARRDYALNRVPLSDSMVNQGDYCNASLYCYVSDDYNGSSVRLYARGVTRINQISTYDLSKKGQWQKLSLSYWCMEGVNSVFFILRKDAPFEVDSIKGHVIIAYPQISTREFNPKDPASGWGDRSTKYLDIEDIDGITVPAGTKGYVIDRDAEGYYSNREKSTISETPIFDFELNELKRISLSVNCYASEDFDGEAWITLSNCNTEKYNINKKGTWQKLMVACDVDSGNYRADLYVLKRGVEDFSSLSGQVIFAYPEFKIEFNNGSYWDVNGMHYPDSALSFVPLRFTSDFYSSSFIPSQGVKDIIRNFLHADTVEVVDYQNVYSDDKFAGSRLDRWRYAMKIYKSYPWWKKLIGGGFAYHSMYGQTFLGDSRLEGYPHNPLLSALLYSGLLGFLLYLFFLLKSVYLYYKHRKDIGYLFVAYAIVTFFCFFSCDIHFSIPIFAILSIIPFLYRYIVEKQKGI